MRVSAGDPDRRRDDRRRDRRAGASRHGRGPGGAAAPDRRRGDAPGAGAGATIDATGKVVAPGFIDLHSHSGLMLLAEPRHEPKVRQGITTEVIGVDGNSYAPFASQQDLDWLRRAERGPRRRPAADPRDEDRLEHGRELPDAVRRPVSLNVAYLDRQLAAADRRRRLGRRPGRRPRRGPTMLALLSEGMEEGAFGLSSGLDYPPGSYATTEELAELAQEAGRHGGFYHTHVRYALGDRFLDPFREAIEIGRLGEAPAHITHFYHRKTFPGGPDRMLDLVDDARTEGLDVTFDAYPSEWASTRLLILIPTVGPGRRPDPDEGAPRRADRPQPHPARAPGARRAVRRRGRPRATSGSATSASRRCCRWRAGRSAR